MTDAPPPWWVTVNDPPAEALARRLATMYSGLTSEVDVLPYPAQSIRAPGCDATFVRVADLVPLWTLFLGVARAQLDLAGQMAVEDVLGAGDTIALPQTPDATWRSERGLDGSTD